MKGQTNELDLCTSPVNILSLFSGVAGLDRGLKLALPSARTVCYVEFDPYAQAVLLTRMQDQTIDRAPLWDNACTFDGRPWRGSVHGIIGGFPCQSISKAGKGDGIKGEKSSLWVEYARIIGEIQPAFAFIENVAALVKRGLNHVLDDLAALGYDAWWDCFTAQEAGAPQLRKRIFILAFRRDELADADRPRRRQKSRGSLGDEGTHGRQPHSDHLAERQGQGVDDTNGVRQPQARRESNGARRTRDPGEELADATREFSERGLAEGVRRGESEAPSGDLGRDLADPAGERPQGRDGDERSGADEVNPGESGTSMESALGPFPPGPDDTEQWARVLAEMPEAAPGICGISSRSPFRIHRLRCLGNSVVPQQAALAFRVLHARALASLTEEIGQ